MKRTQITWLLTIPVLFVFGCGQSNPPDEGSTGEEVIIDVEQDGIPDVQDLDPIARDSSNSVGEAPQNNLDAEEHKSSDNEANEVDFGSMEGRESGG